MTKIIVSGSSNIEYGAFSWLKGRIPFKGLKIAKSASAGNIRIGLPSSEGLLFSWSHSCRAA